MNKKLSSRRPSATVHIARLNGENAKLRRELEELRRELKLANELALHDALTGLLNRRALHLEVEKTRRPIAPEGSEEKRSCSPRCNKGVLAIDLIGFKDVNDRLGHPAADKALKAVAEAMKSSIRNQDSPYRLGGDEFLIILEDVDGIEAMRVITKRIVERIEALNIAHLSARIGGMLWKTERFPNEDLSSVIGAADNLERKLRENLIARTGAAKIDVREYEPGTK